MVNCAMQHSLHGYSAVGPQTAKASAGICIRLEVLQGPERVRPSL
jgi:hypothetical protein